MSQTTRKPRCSKRWQPLGIRRRERVIRVFPNEASALRLIGALLAEMSETWQERLYLDTGDYHEWIAERKQPTQEKTMAA